MTILRVVKRGIRKVVELVWADRKAKLPRLTLYNHVAHLKM